jgi:hypothetical protein
LEDLSVDAKIILKLILNNRMAQDRNRWQAVVQTVMNLWVFID